LLQLRPECLDYPVPKSPRLLIVDDDRTDHAFADQALTAAGWQIDHVDTAVAAVTRAQDCRYALILMGIGMPELDGFSAARAIRSGTGAGAAAAILAFCAPQQIMPIGALRASGFDGHIARSATAEALREAIEPWRPANDTAKIEALAATFGAAAIARLLDGFRGQLEAQLGIDEGAARDAGAHRLAGIAGTLGFPDVSRLWLAVSEGDDTAYPEARISARKALVQIDAFPHGLLV
jgi:CheY-like chemotaxis protein